MTTLSLNFEPALYHEGNHVLKHYNLSPEMGIELFYQYLARTGEIPFPIPNAHGQLDEIPQVDQSHPKEDESHERTLDN